MKLLKTVMQKVPDDTVNHIETSPNHHVTTSKSEDGTLKQQMHGPGYNFSLTGFIKEETNTVYWNGVDGAGRKVTGSDRQKGDDIEYCRIVWGDDGKVLYHFAGATDINARYDD